MAVLPWLRAVVFSFASILALVVIGICAHIESIVAAYQYHSVHLSFVALGLAAGCLTVSSLPVLLIVGRVRRGAVVSMIVFEIVWFFVLWAMWVGTAGDTVAGRAYYFPDGCIYSNYPKANQICYEIIVVEAVAFIIFFCVFIYYATVVLYAIIQANRGRGIWTSSIAEARMASGPSPTSVMPMARYSAVPGGQVPYPTYGGDPQNTPPQPYPQSYNAHPAQPPNQQYYNHPLGSPASGNQLPDGGYSTSLSGNAPLSPQPNYGSYPAVNQGRILPGGYQEHPYYG